MIKTIFIDIDGTIFKQVNGMTEVMKQPMQLLEGVLERFQEWNWKNYKIVLTTGRKESSRDITEQQLRDAGLYWDVLLMGLDIGGARVLINNLKSPDGFDTATAINLEMNEGLSNVKID